jgi:copper chaperone
MIALSVPDMSCDHCSARVKAAVASVDPQAQVAVDLDAQRVTVETASPTDALLQALDAAGYPATLAR